MSATISDLMAAYLADRIGRISSYADTVNAWYAIRPAIGHLRPDQITRSWCRDYISTSGASAATVRKRFAIVRAACNFQSRAHGATFEFPPAPSPRERSLSDAEAISLLQNASAPHIRAFIVLALTTGGRSSALLELKWSQVDLAGERINLGRGRSNKKRAIVPIVHPAGQVLSELRPAALTEYVIEFAGKPVSSIKHGFANACRRAGLLGVTPHVLRHTAAVRMARERVPMPEIARFLGHTNPAITAKHYAHYSPDYLVKAGASLSFELPPQVQMNRGEK